MAKQTNTTPDSMQVRTRQRVADHGEVFTSQREVNAMLDLVKQETERIDSRFLEPACGTGNFLIEVLRRKLARAKERYRKNQLEYERNAVLAVSSLYGIDILEDNAAECRQRLFDEFDKHYLALYKSKCKHECRRSVKFILSKNIVRGDALTMKTADESSYIVFPEWAAVNGSMMKRRDFTFHELLGNSEVRNTPLFSDLGEEAYVPEPIKEYPLVHFLELGADG
ncbi:DNA methyltransferase [Sedimentisphaera salicampi]|uniref:Type I restriction-modification system methyltransferase subunit n=1 Tax=Sedimentisphaera salicampi TaxID=1941349 RepID=A0A1W6LL60_9BACT|nr:DNA methyltransferase [Sedimentisphaera salicampi]ARN56482.1 Type I restriction-modification system methyltransferase subunit [Sedimentisphaera salicampi]